MQGNINTILNSSLVSALLGSLVGGFITWRVTSSSLKEQLEYQKNILDEEKRKSEKVSLISINMEVKHNISQLKNIKGAMEQNKLKHLNLNKEGYKLTLQNEKWIKHSETIISIDDLDCLDELQEFYSNIYFEIVNNISFSNRSGELIELGEKIISSLEREIKKYK